MIEIDKFQDLETVPNLSDKIILSIVIPTFNGEITIIRALESILTQTDKNIEIVVSDNCSDDETPSLVLKMVSEYRFIKYFRNEKNMGYDRNVDIAVKKSRGDFIWLLGDDDVILLGGIKEILDIITFNPQVGVIYANYPNSIKLDKNITGLCFNGDEFFDRNKFKSGFLSSNIFSRELWMKTNVSKYFDSGWIHVGFINEAVPKCESYVTEKLCVDQMRDLGTIMKWGGNGTFIYTGLELVKIYSLMSSLTYSRKTRRKAYWTIKGGYWKNIPLAKAQGFEVDIKVMKEFFILYKYFISFWLFDIPILFMPQFFYKKLLAIYRKYLRN